MNGLIRSNFDFGNANRIEIPKLNHSNFKCWWQRDMKYLCCGIIESTFSPYIFHVISKLRPLFGHIRIVVAEWLGRNIKISITQALFFMSILTHRCIIIPWTYKLLYKYIHTFNMFAIQLLYSKWWTIFVDATFPPREGGEPEKIMNEIFDMTSLCACVLMLYSRFKLTKYDKNVRLQLVFILVFSSTIIHLFCCIFLHWVAFAIAQTHNQFRPLQPWLPRKRKHIQLHTELNFASMSYILFLS